MWVLASSNPVVGGSLALWGSLFATLLAVLTSVGTIVANRAARRKAEAEAAAAGVHSDVEKDRLSLDGLAAYADRLEKENTRLRADLDEKTKECDELRDLRELIGQLRSEP